MELRNDWTWERARSFLPFDLDGLARETGLVARLRGTDSADSLLRLLLMCSLPKASLAQVSDWGRETGLSRMNASALFFRLRASETFLLRCLTATLEHMASAPARRFGAYRLIAVDGTCLCGPGATGVDQRVHVAYDLGSCSPRWIEVTGPHEGEGFARHAGHLGSGDLVLADRGYSRWRGLLAALSSGASLLVRFEFSHLKLLDPATGLRITPEQAAARMPSRGSLEMEVHLPGWEQPLRVLGSLNDVGDPVWLLTNLPALELQLDEARSLYGLRWQVELYFKRLKSLLDLDKLPSRDGPTARPWVLAKLVLATLAVLMADERFSPWGRTAQRITLEEVPQRCLESDVRHPGKRHSKTHRRTKAKAETSPQTTMLLEA